MQNANHKQTQLSLLIVLSFCFHIIFGMALLLPDVQGLFKWRGSEFDKSNGMRDVIVNIQPDRKRKIDKTTLFSDKDSTARGKLTEVRGDRWLNNSRDFKVLKGVKGSRPNKIASKNSQKKIILSKESEVAMFLEKHKVGTSIRGMSGIHDRIAIPDKNSVNLRNAIFYSNDGRFSFNTAKFKNYKFFKKMKDKIASNWYPPDLANVNLGGYAPGAVRVRAIPSQEVKLVFVMNRAGTVTHVKLLDSYGNDALDQSCVEAIRHSKNFGKVPTNVKGDPVVIPFIFGYYIQ